MNSQLAVKNIQKIFKICPLEKIQLYGQELVIVVKSKLLFDILVLFKYHTPYQFNLLTLGAQVFGLLITLSFFYYFNISIVIPSFIEIKKFRTKKLTKNTNSISTMTLDLINNKK